MKLKHDIKTQLSDMHDLLFSLKNQLHVLYDLLCTLYIFKFIHARERSTVKSYNSYIKYLAFFTLLILNILC